MHSKALLRLAEQDILKRSTSEEFSPTTLDHEGDCGDTHLQCHSLQENAVLHFICSWTTVVLTLRHMTPRQCRGTLIGPANLTRHSLQMSAHMADSANPEILNLWLQFGHGCLAESAAHRACARHWVTCGKEPVCQ